MLALRLSLDVKSFPNAAATVAAVWDWVVLMFLRIPSADVSGPITATSADGPGPESSIVSTIRSSAVCSVTVTARAASVRTSLAWAGSTQTSGITST